jgi:hypothetical protein
MLIQLRKVEKFLRETIGFTTLSTLVKKLLKPLIFGGDIGQLLIQVGNAIVVLLCVRVPDELTVIASENNRWTINLVFEYILIGGDLLAAALPIAALEFDLCEKVARDTIDLVELRIASTEGAVIGVLCEPVTLAVRADRLLADLALQRILKDVIAYTAYKFGQESSDIGLVLYVVLLVYKLRLLCLNGRSRAGRWTTQQLDHLLGTCWL